MNATDHKNELNIKHLCSILALALIFILFFFSCNNGNTDDNEKNDNNGNAGQSDKGEEIVSEATTDIPDNLPGKDYEEYNFTIYMREMLPHKSDFAAENIIGELINDAVYNRNKKIEERFNITIELIYYEGVDWTASGAQKVIKAGEDIYDMLALHGGGGFLFAQNDLTFDLFTNMPYINFDAPWWAADTIKNLSAFGKLYCIAGDISHMGLSSTGCILFNKNLFESLNIAYPYSDVTDGKWTLDNFFSIIRSSAADLNGDGEMKIGDDRYGLEIRHDWDYPISVLYCGGDRVITISDDGTPVLSAYNERTIDIFDRFFDMMNSGAAYAYDYNNTGNYPTDTAFRAGHALFFTTYMQDVINHRDLEYEIGILPLPKYDESTPKYYTNVDAGQNVFAVPITAGDTERTSIIIEALCAEGYRTIIPAFYDVSLKTKYSRDDESSAMIDYIKDGRVYDYGYFNSTLAGDLAYIGQRLINTKDPNFTSFYEKNEGKVQKNIDALQK